MLYTYCIHVVDAVYEYCIHIVYIRIECACIFYTYSIHDGKRSQSISMAHTNTDTHTNTHILANTHTLTNTHTQTNTLQHTATHTRTHSNAPIPKNSQKWKIWQNILKCTHGPRRQLTNTHTQTHCNTHTHT